MVAISELVGVRKLIEGFKGSEAGAETPSAPKSQQAGLFTKWADS
jgi:hypothetical protein